MRRIEHTARLEARPVPQVAAAALAFYARLPGEAHQALRTLEVLGGAPALDRATRGVARALVSAAFDLAEHRLAAGIPEEVVAGLETEELAGTEPLSTAETPSGAALATGRPSTKRHSRSSSMGRCRRSPSGTRGGVAAGSLRLQRICMGPLYPGVYLGAWEIRTIGGYRLGGARHTAIAYVDRVGNAHVTELVGPLDHWFSEISTRSHPFYGGGMWGSYRWVQIAPVTAIPRVQEAIERSKVRFAGTFYNIADSNRFVGWVVAYAGIRLPPMALMSVVDAPGLIDFPDAR